MNEMGTPSQLLTGDYFFGRIGVWSSNFSVMSKAVVNYVAIALTVYVFRHYLLLLERLPVLTLSRQLLF